MRIRSRSGKVIDTEDYRERLFVGNATREEHIAVLDAFEAGLSVPLSEESADPVFIGFNNALGHVRFRAGMIEEELL